MTDVYACLYFYEYNINENLFQSINIATRILFYIL